MHHPHTLTMNATGRTERAGRVGQTYGSMVKRFCTIDSAGDSLLENAIQRLGLSARAYHRILKVARTIADLEEAAGIAPHHLLEAIQYRSLDRTLR